MNKEQFITEVVEMAMAKRRRRANIESFMNQYWPDEPVFPKDNCAIIQVERSAEGYKTTLDTQGFSKLELYGALEIAREQVRHAMPAPSSNQ